MEEKAQTKTLDLRPGMTVEVLTMNNNTTFLGKVEEFVGGALTIRESAGRELPPVLYNKEIKLRCFQGTDTVVLQGKICGSTRWIWRVDRLESKFVSEKRNFFRQHVSIEAQVECIQRSPVEPELNRGQGKSNCQIKDVSAGGILLSSREAFQMGDRLSVTDAAIAPGEAPFSFICRVQRAVQEPGGSLCGCAFEALPEKEQERLLRVIFIVQRKELQMKKERGER